MEIANGKHPRTRRRELGACPDGTGARSRWSLCRRGCGAAFGGALTHRYQNSLAPETGLVLPRDRCYRNPNVDLAQTLEQQTRADNFSSHSCETGMQKSLSVGIASRVGGKWRVCARIDADWASLLIGRGESGVRVFFADSRLWFGAP